MKKVLSLVLALVMVLGSFSMVSAAPLYNDVAGDVESAVLRLSTLGILEGYPDGSFKPEGSITRAEFAAVAVRAKGLEAVAKASEGLPTGFKDVLATSWMSGYVGTAGKLGIVNGVGNGMFAPAAPVKYEEAVTMIVRALGYEAAAQAKGGYPYGYLIVANENGLLSAVKGTQGVPATRALVAQLTDNALEVPMMVQVGFGSDAKWVVSGSREHGGVERYLLDDMGFDVYEGTLEVVSTSKGTIKVDGKTLNVGKEFDFEFYEALDVKVWAKGSDAVVYVATNEAMYDATTGAAKIKLVGENKSYTVAKNAELVLDGDDVTAASFTADYAKVVLNEDDEIIWAKGYTMDFIVVEEVKSDVAYAYDGFDELDLEDYTIVKDGKTIAIADLEEGDVVFYNNSQEFAVVYNNSEVGTIERVYTGSFKFEGKTYDIGTALYLDEDVMAVLTAVILDGMKDEKSEVEVFFDFKGEVVLVAGETGVAKLSTWYGILTAKPVDYIGRKGNMVALDILNQNGEEVSYDLMRGLATTDKNFVTAIDKNASEGSLVKVTVDEDGEPTAILDLTSDNKILGAKFKTTANYAKSGGVDYRLQAGTVVFYLVDGEWEVVKLGEVKDEFTTVETGSFYEEANNVKAVKALTSDADTENTNFVGLVTNVRRLLSNAYEFTIEVAGVEKVFVTESKTALTIATFEDHIVKLVVGDKSNKIVAAPTVESVYKHGVVTSINTSNNTFKIGTGTTTYQLTSGATVYDADLKVVRIRDMEGKTVSIFNDGNSLRYINYVLIDAAAPVIPGATGVVTYIDTTVTPNKAVTAKTISLGSTDTLDVVFNNTSDKNIPLLANGAKLTMVNNTTGVATGPTNIGPASASVVLAGKSLKVGNIALTGLAVGTHTALVEITSGTDVFNSEIVITVKNTVASASKVKVLGVEDTTSPFAVAVPFGTNLSNLTASNVVVTPTDPNATVGAIDIVLGTESPTILTATITVEIIAEDGIAKADTVIAITIAAASSVNTLSSTTYVVDNTGFTVTMPATADVAVFKSKLTPAANATFEVYLTDGTTIKTGDMITGDKVIVKAQDGTPQTYVVTVQP